MAAALAAIAAAPGAESLSEEKTSWTLNTMTAGPNTSLSPQIADRQKAEIVRIAQILTILRPNRSFRCNLCFQKSAND